MLIRRSLRITTFRSRELVITVVISLGSVIFLATVAIIVVIVASLVFVEVVISPVIVLITVEVLALPAIIVVVIFLGIVLNIVEVLVLLVIVLITAEEVTSLGSEVSVVDVLRSNDFPAGRGIRVYISVGIITSSVNNNRTTLCVACKG